ncbi:non-homologous end-joining DNA ligase [Hyphomicrobium sp.]|jgi:bifunctional non-homologous end joining protein LigD|uniref:non-homologous end-joining DNA ligase n=1 Tax=Hyphomicrobium sp. TaxID=82 RepID=UPI002CDD1760|nr:non-homologous end-joining DNA ligase [Hyphomicrobium sp.]HVZ05092.1 non-homologous end-joining DNA ligase [Hyphomicrobium sp.]
MKPRAQPVAARKTKPIRKPKSAPKTLSPASIESAIKAPLPNFVPPCLATLVAAPPEGDDWVHEIKFDGYRIQVRIDDDRIKLITRSGLDWTERFGSLPPLLRDLHRGKALIDAEVVAENKNGYSSFIELVAALKSGRSDRFVLQCFDLLHLDGFDLRPAALVERKEMLRRLLSKNTAMPQIRYSEHLQGDGARMLTEACRLGLEGIISKRADTPYHSGRNGDWLKSKCIQVDEFVIIGYVASTVSASAVGALVVGYFDKKRLVYAGRVGTGFSQRVAGELMRILKPLRIAKPAVLAPLTREQLKEVQWVKPERVAQIEYRAWTADNLLRHAAFKGLREDKPATQVRRPVIKAAKI